MADAVVGGQVPERPAALGGDPDRSPLLVIELALPRVSVAVVPWRLARDENGARWQNAVGERKPFGLASPAARATGDRSTNATPAATAPAAGCATAKARRVVPTPPGRVWIA